MEEKVDGVEVIAVVVGDLVRILKNEHILPKKQSPHVDGVVQLPVLMWGGRKYVSHPNDRDKLEQLYRDAVTLCEIVELTQSQVDDPVIWNTWKVIERPRR